MSLDILRQPDLAYDYGQIVDADVRSLAQRAALDIKPRLRRAAQDIVIIGQRLNEVREKLDHGHWLPWLETEFDMTDRTALNFMRVSSRFGDKSEMISDLTPTALYALAAPSTPDDVIVEVERRIQEGDVPSVAETKQIIAHGKIATADGGPQTAAAAGEGARSAARATFSSSNYDRIVAEREAIRRHPDQMAALEKVLSEQPDAAEQILNDLHQERRSWYHDLILCYTDDTDPATWRHIATVIGERRGLVVGTPIVWEADASDDKSALSVETPRERRIAQAQNLPATTYNVILADPPWQYNNTGVNGAAANHYDTMSLSELGGLLWSLDIKIADNAVLFLWVTNPMLQDAFDLINNWGFTYKTNIVWVKDRIGTGFYVRGKHELLLICTKGAMTPIDTNLTPPITSVIVAPTQEHSRKPDQVHVLIEKLYPNCNYIELFARRQRAGWDVWGNEVNQ